MTIVVIGVVPAAVLVDILPAEPPMMMVFFGAFAAVEPVALPAAPASDSCELEAQESLSSALSAALANGVNNINTTSVDANKPDVNTCSNFFMTHQNSLQQR